MNNLSTIGQRLFSFRKEAGYSQRKLSEKTGIERSYITKVENGMTPSFDFLVKLHKSFGISLDWLVFGEGQIYLDDKKELLSIKSNDFIKFIYKVNSLSNEKKEKFISIFMDILNQ